MFVVDRPQFDRHPLDARHTRLLCGGRVVVNSLEETDWARGKLGADESPTTPEEYGGPLSPYEGMADADVATLDDHVALLPPRREPELCWNRPLEEPVLLTPAAWRAVMLRCPYGGYPDYARHAPPPPPTRAQLAAAWVRGLPPPMRNAAFGRDLRLPTDLPGLLREFALAADPGELPAALAAVRRVDGWIDAAPTVPAPGTLHAPADAGSGLTFYLDGPGFPEWPALTADGDGLLLNGWAFRPAGLSAFPRTAAAR